MLHWHKIFGAKLSAADLAAHSERATQLSGIMLLIVAVCSDAVIPNLQEKLLLLRRLEELHTQQTLHRRQQDQLMHQRLHFLDQQLHRQMCPPSLGEIGRAHV